MKHGEAREIVTRQCESVLGARCTSEAIQLAQGIGWLESSYGCGWTGAMSNSRNWGAMQCGSGWKGAYAVTRDYTPVGGKMVPYETRYRCYPSHDSGCQDMVRLLATGYGGRALESLLAGDVHQFSADLRVWKLKEGDPRDRQGYYEGSGPTPKDRERGHEAALWRAIILAEAEMGGMLPGGHIVPPTLRNGSSSPYVAGIRDALGLTPFGDFPEHELRDYQTKRHLVADGVCGPSTWGMLLAEFGAGVLADGEK